MTERALVRVAAPRGKNARDIRGLDREQPRSDRSDRFGRDADLDDLELADLEAGRRKDVGDLRTAEGDRQHRAENGALDLGGVPGKAGGQVDRDDGQARADNVLDDLREESPHGPGEAGPEKAVDDQVPVREPAARGGPGGRRRGGEDFDSRPSGGERC